MPAQLNLFGDEPPLVKKGRSQFTFERGCEHCTLNKKKKVFGEIKGRDILVMAMCPGATEEQNGKPLLGKAGKLFWNRAKELGAFVRSECDVDNVVKCRPTKISEYGNRVNRNPSNLELYCCSLHTERQLRKAKPKVILILGDVARKQFLGKDADERGNIFYDDKRKVWIVCTFHPSYLLRPYVPNEAKKAFDRALLFVHHALNYPGKYGYVKAQNYNWINRVESVQALLKKLVESKRTIFFDIETDVVKKGDHAETILVSIAFCSHVGSSVMVLLRHPANDADAKEIEECERIIAAFMANQNVRKAGWWGIFDITKLEEILHTRVKNYVTDGIITEYLSYPNRKNYMLEKVAELRFPEFMGYKDIVYPEAYGDDDGCHMALVPVERLMLRNCGDADLTRRASLSTMKKHDGTFVLMLIDASFMLHEMSETGQIFDFDHAEELDRVYAPLEKKILNEISIIAGEPDFDPTDDKLRWLFVEKLGLELTKKTEAGKKGDKKGWKAFALGKGILQSLYGEHPIIELVLKLRFTRKLRGTYIEGMKRSALKFNGVAKTRFKLWGTSTGRISSGGDENRKGKGDRVNFQNLHGDPNAKNLLVSTLNWHSIYEAWKKAKAE